MGRRNKLIALLCGVLLLSGCGREKPVEVYYAPPEMIPETGREYRYEELPVQEESMEDGVLTPFVPFPENSKGGS